MLRDIVLIGDKIDVRQLDHMGAPMKSARTYVSQLLDYVDENTISIATPIKSGMVILLTPGENYKLSFYSVKGLYQCNCVMLTTYREKNTVIAVVRLTSDLEKVQRRQYFRLECIHEIDYRLITEEELLLEDKLLTASYKNADEKTEIRRRLSQLNRAWNKASITDLSGGGAKFNSEFNHNPGDKVRIKLDFITGGELKKLVLGADIIASEKLINRSSVYEHRAEFYDIGKNDREDLIKYIFEQERKRRRNDKT